MPNINKRTYCRETFELKEDIEISFIELGKRLGTIRDDLLYTDEWESFEDFLMELKISSSTASKLISIYEKFVVMGQISLKRIAEAGGWSNISECLALVKTKKDAIYWIDRMCELTQTDLRRDVKEAKTGIDMSKCKHKDTFTLRVCNTCGLKERVYEDEKKA